MKINKLTLALFGVATATVAQASFVSIIRLDNVSVASVLGEEIDYTSWVNVHEPYDCTTWSPLTDTVKLGENFEQKRACNQDQERIKSVYRVWDNGNKTLISQDTQSQTLINNENQDATGTRNDVDDTRIGDWTDWTDVGALHSCSSWSPLVTAINHGTEFTQTADCSQDQERTRNIYNVWTDGSETLKDVETDDKTINESKSQQATGIKDYILNQVEGPWSDWADVGALHTCGAWSPLTDTVDIGETFTQTAACKQDQERIRTIYDDWKVGADTVNRVETDDQTINKNNTQQETGTRNDVDDTRIGDWTDWTDVGALHSCSSWSPLVTAINHGTEFIQTADCSQDQERTRNIYNVWTDGSETLKDVETDDKTIDESKSQQATGIKDYILNQVEGPWSDWADVGFLSCDEWTPQTNTVLAGFYFDQSQTCNQNQERTRTIYDDWKLGENTVNRVETENQSTVSEKTQNVEGIKAVDLTELKKLIAENADLTGLDTSKITNFSSLFNNNTTFNQDISNWDVSNGTMFSYMFSGANSFNQSLNNWDLSKATNISGMFKNATKFNGDISNWSLSNVRSFGSTFFNATSFNQPLNEWDVSKGTNFSEMFFGAKVFNQDIGKWNMSSNVYFSNMFSNATSFNQDISGWNVASGKYFASMFNTATSFNQNVSGWNVENATSWNYFNKNSAMTEEQTPPKFK